MKTRIKRVVLERGIFAMQSTEGDAGIESASRSKAFMQCYDSPVRYGGFSYSSVHAAMTPR